MAISEVPPSWSPDVAESTLSLLTAPKANESEKGGVEARNMTLFGEPADQEVGKLMSQNNPLVWSGCQILLWIRDEWGR